MNLVMLLLYLIGCVMPPVEFTPLADAARSGNADQVCDLVLRGADPDEPSGVNEWTPLLHAVHKNQRASVTALLDAGADVDRSSPDGLTPLMMAAGYGNDPMVALLLRRGASPQTRDEDQLVALDYALIGMTDLDAFTLFRCQTATAELLRDVSPPAQSASLRWARMKRCE